MLIHFYEHGTLYKLDPLKRAIIELAALINFDHTASYALGEKKQKVGIIILVIKKHPYQLFSDFLMIFKNGIGYILMYRSIQV